MADSGDNVIGVRTVYDAVLRLEGKFDAQSARLEAEMDRTKSDVNEAIEAHRLATNAKVDALRTEQDYLRGKLDGSVGMVKWLGPTGVAALLVALAKATGLL